MGDISSPLLGSWVFKFCVSGCRVQGAGCRVQSAGCRVQDAGCRVEGRGFRRFTIFGFRVQACASMSVQSRLALVATSRNATNPFTWFRIAILGFWVSGFEVPGSRFRV